MDCDAWNLMTNWDLVLPPSRPSALQLARIQDQITDVDRNSPVAVLGSTPEFRDLLFEAGFKQIYIFERNQRFLTAMSNLRIYDNPERVIDGDWLATLSRFENTFSLILSDLTSGNIPYDDRATFYDSISRALSNGGLFSDKVLTHPGPHIPLRRIIDEFAGLPLNLFYANRFSCEALFCSDLLDIGQIVDSSRFYELLDDRIKQPRVRAFAKYARSITPPGLMWWYGRQWHELERSYCRRLAVVVADDDEPSSPYYGRLKNFLHVKR